MKTLLCVVCVLIALGGCGKKSDLTLPDEPQKNLSGLSDNQRP